MKFESCSRIFCARKSKLTQTIQTVTWDILANHHSSYNLKLTQLRFRLIHIKNTINSNLWVLQLKFITIKIWLWMVKSMELIKQWRKEVGSNSTIQVFKIGCCLLVTCRRPKVTKPKIKVIQLIAQYVNLQKWTL